MSKRPVALREDSDRVLLAVACGRAITVPQLQEILQVSARTARDRLTALEGAGMVTRIQMLGRTGHHLWFLTPAGADAIAMVSSMAPRAPKVAEVQSVLQAHAMAITDTVIALLRSGRAHGDIVGPTWEIEELIRYGQTRRDVLRVDALLPYGLVLGRRTHSATLALEVDRGTETTKTLADKVVTYVRARRYIAPGATLEHWRERWPQFPRLLIVLAHTGRSQQATPEALTARMRDVVNRILADPQARPALDAGELSAAICTLPDLTAAGAHAPVLRTITAQRIREPETIAQFIAPDAAPLPAPIAAMQAQPTPTLPGV